MDYGFVLGSNRIILGSIGFKPGLYLGSDWVQIPGPTACFQRHAGFVCRFYFFCLASRMASRRSRRQTMGCWRRRSRQELPGSRASRRTASASGTGCRSARPGPYSTLRTSARGRGCATAPCSPRCSDAGCAGPLQGRHGTRPAFRWGLCPAESYLCFKCRNRFHELTSC